MLILCDRLQRTLRRRINRSRMSSFQRVDGKQRKLSKKMDRIIIINLQNQKHRIIHLIPPSKKRNRQKCNKLMQKTINRQRGMEHNHPQHKITQKLSKVTIDVHRNIKQTISYLIYHSECYIISVVQALLMTKRLPALLSKTTKSHKCV